MNDTQNTTAQSTARRLTITRENLDRLQRLIDQHSFAREPEVAELLETELQRAEIVDPAEVSPSVITMNSRVLFVDEDTRVERVVQLVYPNEVYGDRDRISVFARVGIALLGLSAGDSVAVPVPNGRTKRVRILRVLFQPEADRRSPPAA